jgi:hypothetical protein
MRCSNRLTGTGPGSKAKKPPVEKSFPKSEETVLRLMVHYPETIRIISREGILKEFESPVLQRMAFELERFYQNKGTLDLTEALEGLEEELRKKLYEFAFEEEVWRRDREKNTETRRRFVLKEEKGRRNFESQDAKRQEEKGLETFWRRQDLERWRLWK